MELKNLKEEEMSPIKGISEIVRLPRLGKIKLGFKEEGADGKSYPTPTDHFVCPEEVKKVFGETPRELRIMFPTEDRQQWASQYLRCYSESGSLICRGDGETALARVDAITGEIDMAGTAKSRLRELPCNPDRCPHYQQDDCRRVMNLQFLLPDCPGFGVYQLDTSSFHSMRNINSMLALVNSVCQRVSMIPMSLQLVEQPVQPDGFDQVAYVLKLNCYLSLVDAQKFSQVPRGKALLPPPDSEAPDDLFPKKVRANGGIPQHSPNEEEKLLNLWVEAKSRIYRHEIQDSQLVKWFEKNYRITIRLTDFDPPKPPAKLTAEMLSSFCQSVDRYCRF